ncbi:MAG: TRAM domain-containing protein, partial [Mailhella sp.]|nr:TRAM domain-containing protein [Mailhella sp.]
MSRMQDMLEIEAESLSSDGRAVGRTPEGIAVFVRGALPGQRVLARVARRRKSFIEAEAERVLRHADGERPPACPHAAECGGCPWQRMPYAEQLRWKRRIVLDALNRIGRLALPPQAVPEPLFARDGATPAEWRFRNKMEFCFAEDDGKTVLGLRARASRSAFDVRRCLLMPPSAMDVL